jgi:hypothetical protein
VVQFHVSEFPWSTSYLNCMLCLHEFAKLRITFAGDTKSVELMGKDLVLFI